MGHADSKIVGAAVGNTGAVSQGYLGAINVEELVVTGIAAVADIAHGQNQLGKGLPRFHTTGGNIAVKQIHRRTTLGKGGVKIGVNGNQRGLVVHLGNIKGEVFGQAGAGAVCRHQGQAA